MKVVHISTSSVGGGAPRAVSRIHQALLTNGIDSEIWVNLKKDNDHSVKGPPKKIMKYLILFKFYFSRFFVRLLKTKNRVLHSPQLFPSYYWIKSIKY